MAGAVRPTTHCLLVLSFGFWESVFIFNLKFEEQINSEAYIL